jgi:GNAT superfamily N-acetyltransferase
LQRDAIYTVREAGRGEFASLPAIERAAAAMFRESRYPEMADAPLAAEAIREDDRVWVVVSESDTPVGFLIARCTLDAIHIQEIDVHPSHARRGLGRRLIEHTSRWARERGVSYLTLTTFADVPWNGPYYARLGFEIVPVDSLTPALRELRQVETLAGLPMEQRISMRMAVSV